MQDTIKSILNGLKPRVELSDSGPDDSPYGAQVFFHG